MWLVDKDGNKTDPRHDSGGVRDVLSLGLRLAKLLTEIPRRERVLILDEPFKNVHGTKERERAAQLILLLADELKIQFILTTGLDWLKIGKVVEL